jgi:hypothetical protein
MYARWLTAYSKQRGMRFYCKALRGEEGCFMAVSSDMTLSCNCNDKYGLGRLGSIESQGLTEMLSGERAAYFRRSLAAGKLPIINCVNCPSLGKVKEGSARDFLSDYHLPSAIMVENTVNCNLHCLACQREEIYRNRTRKSMSLADVTHVARFLKENDIRMVLYWNYGEPFLSATIKEELEIIKEHNPSVLLITSTNGNLLGLKEKIDAASYFDYIYFSIDGSTQESVSKYQRGSDFSTAYGNMKDLVRQRDSSGRKTPIVEWKYLLFRWNDSPQLISRAIDLAGEARVDIISFWPTLSPLYGISLRYHLGLLKHVGQPSWKGREILFSHSAP